MIDRNGMASLCYAAGILSIIIIQSACTVGGGVDVWAIGDGVRVNPQNGKVLIQGKTGVHPDYPARSFKQQNTVWDANTRTATLHSARNEFVAFQVIIETNEPISEVNVNFSSLEHKSGARIEGEYIQIFKEWYVKVRHPSYGFDKLSLGPGWYADALLPKKDETSRFTTGFPFTIPDVYNNIEDQRNHGIWVDIFTPYDQEEAPPGQYTGDVEVVWDGGSQSIHIELNVWDFALPQENHARGEIWNTSIREMPPEKEMAYYHLAKQHRFQPGVYGYKPQLSADYSSGKVEIDWTAYDKQISPYMDGSAFTAQYGYWGPGYGVPLQRLILPFNIERWDTKETAWPIPVPDEGRTARYEAIWKETGRQVREHIDQKPAWRQVEKVAFMNALDESYNEEAYTKMIYYGGLLHDALGRGWFKYRIDGGYSWEAMEKLSSEVELWVCHTAGFDYPKIKHFLKRGVEAWFYGPMLYERPENSGVGSNTLLDLDLNINRCMGWIAWKYRCGWIQWEFDWNAFVAWYEAENFKRPGHPYNLSGQLIYRGEVVMLDITAEGFFGYNEPIPSIRLKSTRRGLQDYEYFWLLAEKTGDAQTAHDLVDAIIYKTPFGHEASNDPEMWRNDPAEWEKVRIQIGDMIASNQ